MPTVFLSELENANLANVSTLERFLWRNTIVPELRLIEDFLNRSLVPAVGLSPSEYRFRFDISEIEALNDSEDSLVAREVSLMAAGVVTPNEVRARHGLAPEPWGRSRGGGAAGEEPRGRSRGSLRNLLPRPPTERNPFLGLGQFESRYY